MDQMTAPGGGDQLRFPATCVSEQNLPCSHEPFEFTSFAGSRSQHADGVDVLKGSGAVNFVSNSIAPAVGTDLHSKKFQ
jgi:hypothetical protein